jgi:alcohol dehydrogenase (cytochrome c)
MKFLTIMSALLVLTLLGPVAVAQKPPVPVTDQMLQTPDPADWLMFRRTLDSWGYSPLNQITRANVGRLQLVWTRGMGPGVQEGTPLVHDGVMYLPNPSDLIQAIDAVTGQLKWEYKRQWPEDLGRFIPFPSINRNIYRADLRTGGLRRLPHSSASAHRRADASGSHFRWNDASGGGAPCGQANHRRIGIRA